MIDYVYSLIAWLALCAIAFLSMSAIASLAEMNWRFAGADPWELAILVLLALWLTRSVRWGP